MATAQDTLITEFKLKDNFTISFKGMIDALRTGLTAIVGIAGTLAGVGAGIGAGFLAAGVSAVRAAADIENLKMGLASVAGSAEEAENQFARLKEMAKLPGLDLEPIIKGSILLQSAGMSARESESAMAKFGNALAIAGGKAEDLEGVIYGIGQLARSPSVLAEDLNIVRERVPQVSKMLEKLYGSSRSEDIAALGISGKQLVSDLIRELAKLPQFAGGANNAFVNLESAIRSFQVALATPLLPMVTKSIEKITSAIDVLDSSGVLKRIGEDFSKAFNGKVVTDSLLQGLAFVVATLEEIPKIVREIRNTFALRFNEMRITLIKTITALVQVFATITVGQGLIALLEFFVTLKKAINMATAAQAAMLVMTVAGAAAVLAGLAAAVGTKNFLEKNIPDIKTVRPGEDAPGRLGNIQRRQREIYEMFQHQQPSATDAGIDAEGSAGTRSGQMPDWKEHTKYLREIASNTREAVDQRIIGGGGYTSMAINDVGFSRAVGGTSKIDQIKRMLDEYMRELVATEVGTSNRRLGHSPVRQ